MKYLLIGEAKSKRTVYFQKAARALGVRVEQVALDLGGFSPLDLEQLSGAVVKIDPPRYPSSRLSQLPHLMDQYSQVLRQLGSVPGASFLNQPEAILATLDKVGCKEKLLAHGVATTPMLRVPTGSWAILKAELMAQKVSKVFIKPQFGSGAAGVLAYSYQAKSGQEALYAGVTLEQGELQNSKRLVCYRDSATIEAIGQKILATPVIVEKWLPKAQHQGKSYDLRVVWQFGQMAYVVARQSDSPITNLHLSNGALPWQRLQLPLGVWRSVAQLAGEAMALFPGLSYGGLDILLSGEKLKPYLIEINGQGDLIYQDIFKNNGIYTQQIERMMAR